MKWHWEIISELLSGALLNPAHLSKALSTKFIKRILSFLRPSNRLFSTMAWTAVCGERREEAGREDNFSLLFTSL
jgi:hypothetical protein